MDSDPYQEAFNDVLKNEPWQQCLAYNRILARRRAIAEGAYVPFQDLEREAQTRAVTFFYGW